MLEIRPESIGDEAAIRHVNECAFARQNEADLVDALRAADEKIISLVAVQGEQIVGHIMFSPVRIESTEEAIEATGLGPMAVLPTYQRQGIGSRLVEKGLQVCREREFSIAVVLGHPAYYPRFGFAPSKPLGIRWEQDVPEDVFMVLALTDNALAGVKGIVRYHPAFNGV